MFRVRFTVGFRVCVPGGFLFRFRLVLVLGFGLGAQREFKIARFLATQRKPSVGGLAAG